MNFKNAITAVVLKKMLIGAILGLSMLNPTTGMAIVNGSQADSGLTKDVFYIDLEKSQKFGRCTGVLIAANVILTAGHCLAYISKAKTVQIAHKHGNSLTSFEVEKIVLHPNFILPDSKMSLSGNIIQYDVALLMTKNSIAKRMGALPVAISTSNLVTQNLLSKNNSKLLAIGYGLIAGSGPRTMEKKKRSLLVSVETLSSQRILRANSIKSSAGLCGGDSGSGLYANVNHSSTQAALESDPKVNFNKVIANRLKSQRQLVGILSGVVNSDKCTTPNNYAAYLIVSDHFCWIEKTTNMDFDYDGKICQ